MAQKTKYIWIQIRISFASDCEYLWITSKGFPVINHRPPSTTTTSHDNKCRKEADKESIYAIIIKSRTALPDVVVGGTGKWKWEEQEFNYLLTLLIAPFFLISSSSVKWLETNSMNRSSIIWLILFSFNNRIMKWWSLQNMWMIKSRFSQINFPIWCVCRDGIVICHMNADLSLPIRNVPFKFSAR